MDQPVPPPILDQIPDPVEQYLEEASVTDQRALACLHIYRRERAELTEIRAQLATLGHKLATTLHVYP